MTSLTTTLPRNRVHTIILDGIMEGAESLQYNISRNKLVRRSDLSQAVNVKPVIDYIIKQLQDEGLVDD